AALAAVSELLAEGVDRDGIPADGDPEPEPPAAEDVHGRGLLGDEGRLALGQDEDAGDELDAPGDRGEEAEEDQRLVELVAVRVRPLEAAGPVGVGAEHVVEGQDVRVAQLFHGLRPVADRRGIGADLDLGEDGADPHQRPLKAGGRFAAKAVTPSRKSSVCPAAAIACDSSSICVSRLSWVDWWKRRLAAAIARVVPWPCAPARPVTDARRSASGTTLVTRPHSSASRAESTRFVR